MDHSIVPLRSLYLPGKNSPNINELHVQNKGVPKVAEIIFLLRELKVPKIFSQSDTIWNKRKMWTKLDHTTSKVCKPPRWTGKC